MAIFPGAVNLPESRSAQAGTQKIEKNFRLFLQIFWFLCHRTIESTLFFLPMEKPTCDILSARC